MLKVLEEIFETGLIQTNSGGAKIPLHSNTSKKQGLFLQEIFDRIKPVQSIEVGFAYGISTLFILEKHREYAAANAKHIVIEPDDYWGTAAVYNISKEGLDHYLDIRRHNSDYVLPKLFHEGYKIQYAYIDTTKRFDVVMQDFYFLDKMLEVSGVIILDDCGGGWPGIQRVARYVSNLRNYQIIGRHARQLESKKKKMARLFLNTIIKALPFTQKVYPTTDFENDVDKGINYNCIAFQKTSPDERSWDWDARI